MQSHGLLPATDRSSHRPTARRESGQRPRGSRGTVAKSSSLFVEPFIERAGARDGEGRQEVPAIQADGDGELPRIECILELRGVAGEAIPVDGQGMAPRAMITPGSERLAKLVNRLTKRVAGAFFWLVRPEEGKQRVAEMKAVRVGHREIHQQRQSLRVPGSSVRPTYETRKFWATCPQNIQCWPDRVPDSSRCACSPEAFRSPFAAHRLRVSSSAPRTRTAGPRARGDGGARNRRDRRRARDSGRIAAAARPSPVARARVR